MGCRLPVSDIDPIIAADLDLIRDTARGAGALALEFARDGAAVWQKSPGNPVTEADIAVNDHIAQKLLTARPTYGWLSEESRDDPDKRDATRIFVVDPIDGTLAFIRGEPFYCVAIARLEHDRAVCGVVYNPRTDEMFEAVRGGGARLNGVALRASDADSLDGCRMIGHEDLFQSKHWKRPWPAMNLASPVPNAIAYRLALVATGRWDAALSLKAKGDWDLAAAALILEEAGGLATDHTGARYSFNGRIPQQTSVVAAGAALHPLLIDRVKSIAIPNPGGGGSRTSKGAVAGRTPDNDPQPQTRASGMSKMTAPKSHDQLLHIVIGGELKNVTGVEFEDVSKIEFVGAFGSYTEAYDAWKAASQRTVDNAEMRFFILHAHRLMDPETGHTHDV